MINQENYRKIYEPINSTLFSVQNKDSQWGVIDENENIIIPFGKYRWIDGFRNGLAKVVSLDDTECGTWEPVLDEIVAKQGIINENGEEVLPLEYKVYKFYNKSYQYITLEKDGEKTLHPFSAFATAPENDNDNDSYGNNYDDYDDYYEESYGEFAGTYAQDYMGYSDDAIYDAFDGEADAYWNID